MADDQPTKDDYLRLIRQYTDNEDLCDSTRYYLKIFDKFNNKKWFTKWNWAAFLFAPVWLGYRRMHGYAFMYLLFIFVEGLFSNDYFEQTYSLVLLFLLEVSIRVFLGMFGNALYFISLRRRIERQELFGGTNGTFVGLWFLVYFIIVFFQDALHGLTMNPSVPIP